MYKLRFEYRKYACCKHLLGVTARRHVVFQASDGSIDETCIDTGCSGLDVLRGCCVVLFCILENVTVIAVQAVALQRESKGKNWN